MFTVYSSSDPFENNIAERTVPYCIIAGTSEAYSLAMAVQNTICYRYLFANSRLSQIFANRPQNDAVISSLKKAVTDNDPAAAVDIYTVIIANPEISGNVDP